jgi:hypothetical protein
MWANCFARHTIAWKKLLVAFAKGRFRKTFLLVLPIRQRRWFTVLGFKISGLAFLHSKTSSPTEEWIAFLTLFFLLESLLLLSCFNTQKPFCDSVFLEFPFLTREKTVVLDRERPRVGLRRAENEQAQEELPGPAGRRQQLRRRCSQALPHQ